MTYASFLLLFLVAPLTLVIALQPRSLRTRGLLPLGVLLGVVYAATIPWDSAAVARGLWSFDVEKTWSPRIAGLPLEELCFFGLQTLLIGLWVRRRLFIALPARVQR